jgi:SAM-dependent methyltransferase
MTDPTQRFSNRVENYLKHRPKYPWAVISTLREECGLTGGSVIADIGSGTGILAEMFLRNGNRVFAVEPNREMREAGTRRLRGYPLLTSIDGRAEDSALSAESCDFVTAGQAFHWFDRGRARSEFRRILKPSGWVMLVWNDRRTESTPFLAAYEKLLRRFATDYEAVNHKRMDAAVLAGFFGAGGFKSRAFPNRQDFDLEGLRGRLLSSSYIPEAGHPEHEPMLRELERIFREHQENGRVAIEYETAMHYGRLEEASGR